ncbi:hypothetical protein BUALT_Bualt04G0165900 [Buddleja alternifolia]|uniref:Uncharacterized protein n=1 Tax=Buddleja alternifolia TaxID=168488 RepID=A0AAV6XPI3_9LAMI|nr:hypothetical protein BUALT_Bualt04G0165900 [Buddleja alternifolia]
MAMATAKPSYQRLKQEIWFDDEEYAREKVFGRLKSSKFRRSFHIRRRLRVKIPNLKRLLRRKARVVKVAWNKVYKRLKESQSHFGDLFAGNYLFMQVTPTSLKYANSGNGKSFVKGHDHQMMGLSSRFNSVPRIA